jgi:hypothetical protein
MSSWKKYLLYGGGATATALAIAIYGYTRDSPKASETGGSFDQFFKHANEEALKRQLNPQRYYIHAKLEIYVLFNNAYYIDLLTFIQ